MSYFWTLLTSEGSLEFLTLLALAALKATLLLAFAALLCVAFRRLSAATRHLVWACALCASLLLPLLSLIKMWEVPMLPAHVLSLSADGAKQLSGPDKVSVTSEARLSSDSSHAPGAGEKVRNIFGPQTDAAFREGPLRASGASGAQPPPQPPPQQQQPFRLTSAAPAPSFVPQLVNSAFAVWGVVVLLFLLKLLAGFIAIDLLTRRAVGFEDPALTRLFSSLLSELNLKSTVRLLRSERTSMPIVYGIVRPAVLLPAEAEEWSEERRRMVLLHELTHVTRRDCLTQMLAQLACAVYWFNPLIWFAARRLRVEREQACDDYVLSIGTKPSDYANHLLEIARSMQERSVFEWSQTTSVAMARRSQLEERLLAILSKENQRGAVSRAVAASLVGVVCALLLSLAAIRPTVIHAQNPRASHAASIDSQDDAQSDVPESSVPDRAGRGVGAVIRGAAAREAAAAVDGLPQRTPAGGHMGNEIGRNMQGEFERKVEQVVVEAAAERIATAEVQTSDATSVVGQAENPFINAGYPRERALQTQNRSGDFIDEMAAAGYTNLSVDELIRLKSAGVNAEYVRSLRALGFAKLTTKDLASMSLHGVTPAYVRSLRAAGYDELSAKDVTKFRVHSITPEYIKTLRDAGFDKLTAKQLIEFRVHGVTPAFIAGIRAAGYGNVSAKELVSLRVFGVTPEFIRKARGRLGEMTLKQIISLKNIGILDDEKDKEKNK